MNTDTLSLTDTGADLAAVGGKGSSLARLARAGFPVPDAFHVTTAAYRRVVEANGIPELIETTLRETDTTRPEQVERAARAIRRAVLDAAVPPETTRAIGTAYAALGGGPVAVRSSATAEDLPNMSFAGQQESYLNVRGAEAVVEAVRKCWASLWTDRAVAYRARQGVDNRDLALAVVVQVLVDAEASGILFTADPSTGRRDRLVIDAAWGLGEAIVGGRVTPDVLVVDRGARAVVQRTTSDKSLRTVRAQDGTREEGVDEALRRRAVLSDGDALELAGLGERVEAFYGHPVDIEWARTNGKLWLVQARPITALPEAEPAPPETWNTPLPKTRWSRGSVADLLPDPLSPLFATLGLRVYGEAFDAGMSEMFDIEGAGSLYGPAYALTINGYAYVSLNVSPRLFLVILPRIGRVFRIFGQARARWEIERDAYRAVVERAESLQVPSASATELVDAAETVWRAAARHVTVYQTTGASAAVTEMLLMRLWEKDKKRRRAPNDPPASALLLGYESDPVRADASLWDLTQGARAHADLVTWIAGTEAPEAAGDLVRNRRPQAVRPEAWAWLRGSFLEHIRVHGRTIHTLDFATPTPSEEPHTFLMTVRHWLEHGGTDPRTRQANAASRRESLSASLRERARGPAGWMLKKALGWAQRAAPLREDSIAAMGLGVPVIRAHLLEVGRRLVDRAALESATDVFWLEEAELRLDALALDRGVAPVSRAAEVRRRKTLWKSRKRATPPHTVPYMKSFMGFKVSDFVADGTQRERGRLSGVAASGGRVTAPARVLRGPEDFARMRSGEVLVADITTPAWTPLFALASAVVTDVGGPLSHGSIVAREYGIPAVLGTGSATRRIHDGDLVTVDGDKGSVSWAEAGEV